MSFQAKRLKTKAYKNSSIRLPFNVSHTQRARLSGATRYRSQASGRDDHPSVHKEPSPGDRNSGIRNHRGAPPDRVTAPALLHRLQLQRAASRGNAASLLLARSSEDAAHNYGDGDTTQHRPVHSVRGARTSKPSASSASQRAAESRPEGRC